MLKKFEVESVNTQNEDYLEDTNTQQRGGFSLSAAREFGTLDISDKDDIL